MYQVLNIVFLISLSFYNLFYCNNNTNNNAKTVSINKFNISEINNNIEKQYNKISEIPVPDGYERIETKDLGFGWYLRNLKLNTDKTVYSYDGSVVMGKNGYQFAVIDIDIGKRNLQQCADAIMRLRGEYLYHQKKYSEIHFNFLSDGKPRYYTSHVKNDRTYNGFRKYMDYIFSYANTGSLKKELHKVNNINDMQIGDVFIQSGKPYGHAVIIVDIAKHKQTGKIIFMVAQSFMPAQSIHILKNYNSNLSPWYSSDFGKSLELPSWTFFASDLHRF